MGILVQREFTVAGDNRQEFERQSRVGLWEDQRNNGSQMVAFGIWGFGGDSSVVVTHSAYADFDHWTATRGWGVFNSEPERAEEARQWRQVFAGRSRLILHSRASIYNYDDALSEPTPRWRNVGEPRVAAPPTFGPQSVVAETSYQLKPGSIESFREITGKDVFPWYRENGIRPMIYGANPLGSEQNVVVLVAYPDITAWHQRSKPLKDSPASEQWAARADLVVNESTRLLLLQTTFGEPVTS
jgi:hypothetical protein